MALGELPQSCGRALSISSCRFKGTGVNCFRIHRSGLMMLYPRAKQLSNSSLSLCSSDFNQCSRHILQNSSRGMLKGSIQQAFFSGTEKLWMSMINSSLSAGDSPSLSLAITCHQGTTSKGSGAAAAKVSSFPSAGSAATPNAPTPGSSPPGSVATHALASSAPVAAPASARGLRTAGVPMVPQVTEEDPCEIPDELSVYRGLVLDGSYRPINVVCWKRALCLEIADKVDVLEYYDAVVKSANHAFPIPAVLRVTHFTHTAKSTKRKLSLSRNNIFLRDKFKCQYCGSKDNLTIDHVHALSRGGGSTWENLVTACSPCNLKKGDKSPAEARMKLMSKPKEPRELDCRNLPPNYKTFRSLARHRATPPQWLDWLPLQQPNPF